MSQSSNAVLTRARAMFGKRLTEEDYRRLLSLHSVGQVAAELKQIPGYEALLEHVNENTVHRLQLEELLRRRHFENFDALARFELSAGEKMADYIIHLSELELIIEALMRIRSPENAPEAFFPSEFLDRHLSIDVGAMLRAERFEEVVEAAKGSVFYRTLLTLAPTADSNPDLSTYESFLYSEFYQRLLDRIRHSTSGGCQKELLDMIVTWLDLTNLVRIYRMKHYFNAPTDSILGQVLPGGSIPADRLRAMAEAPPELTVHRLAEIGRIHPKHLRVRYSVADELPQRYLLKISTHNIRYSTHPPVVMLSYLFFSNIEISNIIKIVEGCRYQLSPEQIREMLIL